MTTQAWTWALDLGVTTGWCIACEDDIRCGTWWFTTKRGDGAGIRFLRFEHKLSELHEMFPVCHLIYERPINYTGRDSSLAWGFAAILSKWGEKRNIPYECFGPTEIKKHATGRGNAKKSDVCAAAFQKWPEQNIVDDNVADALWLMDLARSQL